LNLFLDRLSFFSLGIDPKARNKLLGVTKTESVLKLLDDKFNSSSAAKKLRSNGKVQKSLDAISSTLSFCRYPNSYKWLGGILLYDNLRVAS
jgi:hypothetical protein